MNTQVLDYTPFQSVLEFLIDELKGLDQLYLNTEGEVDPLQKTQTGH